MRRLLILLLWVITSLPALGMAELLTGRFAESVVKVRAVGADGGVTFGSAVVVGSDTLATACHVTRDAKSIEISHGTERWAAETQVGSLSHDLCFLTVRGLQLPILPTRLSTDLRVGERVIAAGFPGGGSLVLDEGVVEALYTYDEGRVIRTSATFDFGASGGGLFDEAGNLVGFLSFKGRAGESLHFALPVDWALPGNFVASTFVSIERASRTKAFWERPKSNRPLFLGVALIEASRR